MGLGIGTPLESDHPKMVDAIRTIRESCVRHGVAPGIHTSGPEGVNQRIAEGFQFCAMASELRFLLSGLQSALSQLNWTRSPAGESGPAGSDDLVRY
jgi:2-keto-3-deoxy-L-rhamnonate aldolase RhmA